MTEHELAIVPNHLRGAPDNQWLGDPLRHERGTLDRRVGGNVLP
jgi:hypothetical protein